MGTPSIEFPPPHLAGTIYLYIKPIFLAQKIFRKRIIGCLLPAQNGHLKCSAIRIDVNIEADKFYYIRQMLLNRYSVSNPIYKKLTKIWFG